jgi:hypothetical protein
LQINYALLIAKGYLYINKSNKQVLLRKHKTNNKIARFYIKLKASNAASFYKLINLRPYRPFLILKGIKLEFNLENLRFAYE